MAGSVQMGGAVALCSDAAMRTGVGYTKVMTAEENRNLLLSTRPEVLFYPVGEGRFPIEKFSDCNAIAAGPGMGTGKSAQKQIEALLDKEADCSLVLDADAINIMAERQDLKEKLKIYAKRVGEKGYRVILTPHQKEFSRFSGIPMDTKAAKRHEKALETAADFGVVLVLKDAVTRIYTPDGIVYVNTTGNPGMSTAGSGDVLTGIICGGTDERRRHSGCFRGLYSRQMRGLCCRTGKSPCLDGNGYGRKSKLCIEMKRKNFIDRVYNRKNGQYCLQMLKGVV